jgi:hypothetical protein
MNATIPALFYVEQLQQTWDDQMYLKSMLWTTLQRLFVYSDITKFMLSSSSNMTKIGLIIPFVLEQGQYAGIVMLLQGEWTCEPCGSACRLFPHLGLIQDCNLCMSVVYKSRGSERQGLDGSKTGQ